jgi:hypothetical protein
MRRSKSIYATLKTQLSPSHGSSLSGIDYRILGKGGKGGIKLESKKFDS